MKSTNILGSCINLFFFNNNTFTDNVKSHEGIDSVVYYDRTSDNSYQVEKGFGLTSNLSSQNKETIRHDFPDPDEVMNFHM